MSVRQQPLSIDDPLPWDEPGEQRSFAELIPDTTSITDQRAARRMNGRLLRVLLASLPQRERTILELHHGIQSDEAVSLRAIGRQMGLCGERVRQIEVQAKGLLRERLATMRAHGSDFWW